MISSQLQGVVRRIAISLATTSPLFLIAITHAETAAAKPSFDTSGILYEKPIGIPCSLSQWISTRKANTNTDPIKLLQECHKALEDESEAAYTKKDWQRLIELTERIIEIKEYALGTRNYHTDTGGIGITFEKRDVNGYPIVETIIKGLAAEKVGIKKGSLIKEIDGRNIRNISRETLINQIRGKEGSRVTLTFKQGRVTRVVAIARRRLPENQQNDLSAFWRENNRLYLGYFQTRQIGRAAKIFPTLLKSVTDKHGRNSVIVAETLLDHARLLNISDQYHDSQIHLAQAERIYKKLGLTTTALEIDLNSLALSNAIGSKDYHESRKAFLHNFAILDTSRQKLDEKQLSKLANDVGLFVNSGACMMTQSIDPRACLRYTTLGYESIAENIKIEAKLIDLLRIAHVATLSNDGRTEEAIKLLDQSLDYYRANLPKHYVSLLLGLNQKAALLNRLGNYWQAEKNYLAAVNVAIRYDGENSNSAIESKLNLASHYSLATSQVEKAEKYFEDIISHLSRLGNDEKSDQLRLKVYDKYISWRSDLANAPGRISRFEKSIIRIIAKYPNDTGAQAVGNVLQAKIALANEAPELAKRLIDAYIVNLKIIMQAYRKRSGIEIASGYNLYKLKAELADAYKSLSMVQSLMNQGGPAKANILRSIRIAEDLPNPFDYSIPSYYHTLGQINISMGALRVAHVNATAALSIGEKYGERGVADVAQSQLLLGGIEAIQKRYKAASHYFDQYINISFERLVKKVWLAPFEQKRGLVEQSTLDTNWLYQDFGVSPELNQTALKARINLYSLAKETELVQSTEMQIKNSSLVRKLENVKDRLSNGQLANPLKEDLQIQVNELEAQLASSSPIKMRGIINLSEISRSLPEGGNLIQFQKYYAYPTLKKFQLKRQAVAKYAVFVLSRDGQVDRIEIGNAKDIDSSINKALEASSENLAGSSAQLLQLSDIILGPLTKYLSPGSPVFIVPDSNVNLVPFSALTTPRTQASLGSYVSLRILGSGRDLVVENQQKSTPWPVVIIANPDFNLDHTVKEESMLGMGRLKRGSSSAVWEMLPSTEIEGRHIARLLNGRMISGKDATVDKIKALVSPRILHVASHGFTSSKDVRGDYSPVSSLLGIFKGGGSPQESRAGFVLAGANFPVESDDGVISLGEAASLRLNGTELVVLSGCTTALGTLNSGDGVFGLQRALTIAGARSTLLSLWKVDDAATAEFMVRYYQRLKAGEGRSDALAAVQEEFRSGKVQSPSGANWKEPYYWAAWQLVGDWRPIKGL